VKCKETFNRLIDIALEQYRYSAYIAAILAAQRFSSTVAGETAGSTIARGERGHDSLSFFKKTFQRRFPLFNHRHLTVTGSPTVF
jgi:hypothetical protein